MATASSGTYSALLPPVKSVTVYRNGDPFYCGRRFVVNQRQIATMEAFLNDVTLCIGAPLAVRTLYTPRQGHRVNDFQELQTGARYVAAGFEKFKKLDYLNSGVKKPVACEGTQAKKIQIQRPNVSAKWRKFIPLPCIIHVFRNGDLLCPAFRLIIPRNMQQDLEQILSLVTEKASLRTGAARRLCSLDGVTISSTEELETGQYYVAVGTERFKKMPYLELLASKTSERHYAGNRRSSRRFESRKAGSGPEDRYSDSALLDSPESDGRRVKSTGDEALEGPPPHSQVPQTRRRREGKEESSIFYARPVKVRKNRGHPRPLDRAGRGLPSVFKGAAHRKREELRGAEEVPEDASTAVELPVDQRVAETVEDEELIERVHYSHITHTDKEIDQTTKAEGLSGKEYNKTVHEKSASTHLNGRPVSVKSEGSTKSISDLNAEMSQTLSSVPVDNEQSTAAKPITPVGKEENAARTEEGCVSATNESAAPEPELASSNSRASSSTSHGSRESKGIQGEKGIMQESKSSLQSSKSLQHRSRQNNPSSFVMDQSTSQNGGLAAEESVDQIKPEVT